ncbi:MAG: dockerin type I repeat-containing protein [Armatimonadetes bacterium]|nr:dockerin type I repeat-containing protein [Armatimonadota bacterium]
MKVFPMKVAWIFCGFGFASIAMAQSPRALPVVSVSPKSIEEVKADRVAPIGADGQIGPWIDLKSTGISRNAPTWVMAWDSMSTNPSTLAAYSGNPYGTSPGPQRIFLDDYRIYQVCNDMRMAGSTAKFGRFARIGIFWNPNGTKPASGSGSCYIKITAAAKFDDSGYGPAADFLYSGIVASVSNLTSGSKFVTVDLSSTNLGMPLPIGTGALQIEIGSIGSGNTFQKLQSPAAAYPLWSNMLSPGEPQFPGTNPSGSGDLEWEDDTDPALPGVNLSNYIFEDFSNTFLTGNQFAEQYSLDYTSINKGVLQTAAALFADTNIVTIGGTVNHEDVALGVPKSVSIEIYDASTNSLLSTQTVPVSTSGKYVAFDPRQATGGNYKIYAKTSHWLRKLNTVNTTGAISKTNINFSLQNGDVDGDNAVTIFDYLALSSYFDKNDSEFDWKLTDAGGLQPRLADLDEDGSVSIFDYVILSRNFDLNGD